MTTEIAVAKKDDAPTPAPETLEPTSLSPEALKLKELIISHPRAVEIFHTNFLLAPDIQVKLQGTVHTVELRTGKEVMAIVTGLDNKGNGIIGIMRVRRLYRNTAWHLYGEDSYLVVAPINTDPNTVNHEQAFAIQYDPEATATKQREGPQEWHACCTRTHTLNGNPASNAAYMEIARKAITEANKLLKS